MKKHQQGSFKNSKPQQAEFVLKGKTDYSSNNTSKQTDN